MKKKIISLLLAFMMLAMVSLSVPAQAAEIERSEYITTADTASETVGSSREDITAHSKDVQEGTKTDTMVENTSPFNEYPDNISNTSGNYITENIVSAGFPLEPDEDAIENPVMTPENQAQLNAYKKKLLSEIKEDGYALNRSALSLFSASNIPTFNQYLADYNYHFNCYDFYKNEFKMPYRSYVETRKDDPVYQGLLAAWRIATFELSDAAKYSNKEIGFYETILYDVLYQGQDMESLSGSLAKYVKSVQPSSLKKISKFLGEDFDHMFYQNITTLNADQLQRLNDACQSCEELAGVFSAIGNISKILGYVDNIEELIYKLAKAQAIAQRSNETAKILLIMQSSTSNAAFKAALDNMILVCSNTVSEEKIIQIFTSDMVVNELSEYILGEVWGEVIKHLNLYGYAVSAGQAAGKLLSHWLFSTDESIELYYSACALYEFENVLKSAMRSYESRYLSSQSNDNSSAFNEAYKMLLQTHLLGIKTSKEIVEVEHEKGLMNTLLNCFKEENYDDYYNSLKSIQSSIELTIQFMDTIAYNGYIEEYGGEEAALLDIQKEPETYTKEEVNDTVVDLQNVLFVVNNVVIDSDRKLTEDMHTYGSLTLKGGTLDLNGHTLQVDGNVYQTGGTMNINAGKLIVGEDYSIAGSVTTNGAGEKVYTTCDGSLKMAYAYDSVQVGGDFTIYSNSSNYVTDGILEIKGDFTQGGSRYSFSASGNHKVIFSGTEQQNISFDSTASGFANVEFKNPNTINLKTTVFVGGSLRQSGGTSIIHPDNIMLNNQPAFDDHGELNTAINKYVGNAENVIPTYKDYEAYIAQAEKPAYPYIIKEISLKTASGADLEAPPVNQSFIVNVDLVKQQNREERDYIFVAVYGVDGALLSMNYVQAKFTSDFLYSFGINIPAQAQPIGSIKAFIWNTFHSMQPLAESKSL